MATVATQAADEAGAIARGGRLYDNWFSELKVERPATTHAAWPADNTQKSGAVTWRCKSCHGWDSMGRDGAYAAGSYKTGIPGLRKLVGAPIDAIAATIGDARHALADKLGPQDIQDLALFVSKGQFDVDVLIDRATKAVKGGDVAKGAAYYATVCSNCHGADGDQPAEMPESLGLMMSDNPYEVVHKTMNGQPHQPMPALRAFDTKVVADILAYVATLPKKAQSKK
jgi:cytochrome c553